MSGQGQKQKTAARRRGVTAAIDVQADGLAAAFFKASGERFSYANGKAEATLPTELHARRSAVIAAARGGNDMLIRLALTHLDAWVADHG